MKRKLNEHDVPEPASHTFADFNVDDQLLQSIAEQRFEKPTAIQTRTIPLIQEGKSVAACSKTGSGKTVAYLLPILDSVLRSKTTPPSTLALILVPSKELASQITAVVQRFSRSCSKTITYANISKKEDDGVVRARLREHPRVVIGTPGRVNHFLNGGLDDTAALKYIVIDEADLILTYGYEDDLRNIASAVPSSVQTIFMSATLGKNDELLAQAFGKAGAIEAVDLTEHESAEEAKLEQYVVPTAEDEKFLLLYAIFKLQLVKGKVIIFVADIDRCYRLKLFLEQFGIRSCVLNSELPVNSRLHVVEEFNRGVYDTIIAADDSEVVGNTSKPSKSSATKETHASGDEEEDEGEAEEKHATRTDPDDNELANVNATRLRDEFTASRNQTKRKREDRRDLEYGVSRGIDFRRVTCILNFDLPLSSTAYTHRIGRTARAGQKGMALSFFVPTALYRKHKPTSIPQCAIDEKILARIRQKQEEAGARIEQWQFDMEKLAGFRYRLADALRAVTRIAVREARTRELRQELINSARLQRHFEEHPEELRHLRHDTESHAVRHQAHLKHVPDYLLPNGGKAALTSDLGFIGLKKRTENRHRRARALNKARGKGRLARSKGLDPLKSLNAKGRGKK